MAGNMLGALMGGVGGPMMGGAGPMAGSGGALGALMPGGAGAEDQNAMGAMWPIIMQALQQQSGGQAPMMPGGGVPNASSIR
jgi:hypothetical protein